MLKRDPDDAPALVCLGAALSDTGKHAEALEVLRKAERLGATDRNLFFNIAVAMMNLESERAGAMEYFDKAVELERDDATLEAYFDPHGH